MLLAIDTSTRHAGVALADDGKVIASRSWLSTVNHTAELMPAVSEMLGGRDLSVADLEGFAVALGPGGFSALRVGVSVAKGLAMTAQKPLVGVGTLELEAFPYLKSGLPVCALLEAGRGQVASASFAANGLPLEGERIGAVQELIAEIKEPTIFCGEGASIWEYILREELADKAILISPYTPAQRLWSLAELGQQRLAMGETSDLVGLQPNYLRMPTIGAPKRRDWVPQQS